MTGALTIVVISWLAMFLSSSGQHWYGPPATEPLGVATRRDGAKSFQISRGANAWHQVVSYWWMQISGRSMTILSDDPAYRMVALETLPRHMRPASIDDLDMQSWYHATGWPLPALTCGVHWDRQILNANIIYSMTGGLQLPRDAEFNPHALPLRPLWPGFALDTLLFAAAWWLLLWTAGALRRAHRRHRGQCVHCGYSMRGLPVGAKCPECGVR